MAETTYVLNALVSVLCTALLWTGWRRSRSRLLLWSALCFGALTANNVLLFVDELVIRDVDLSAARAGSALVGFSILLFGMIWDS